MIKRIKIQDPSEFIKNAQMLMNGASDSFLCIVSRAEGVDERAFDGIGFDFPTLKKDEEIDYDTTNDIERIIVEAVRSNKGDDPYPFIYSSVLVVHPDMRTAKKLSQIVSDAILHVGLYAIASIASDLKEWEDLFLDRQGLFIKDVVTSYELEKMFTLE